MFFWKCPVCNSNLNHNHKYFVCSNNHSYDLSKQGYLNLLQSQRSKKRQHGDEKTMVLARQAFLETGKYSIFRDNLHAILNTSVGEIILDAGCGEGYYSEPFQEKENVYGIDISKDAILLSSKRNKKMNLAVASTFAIPMLNNSVDKCFVVFAPFDPEEIVRVLKPGGMFIEVFPLEKHLIELKKIVYPEVYENEVNIKEYNGLEIVDVRRVEHSIELENNTIIQNLFSMTPYYHRSPQEGKKELSITDYLKTSCGFGYACYKKKDI